MFGLFKKKQKQVELFSVCDGVFKSIEKVNDTVFADKIMGDGFAITPVNEKIEVSSPIKGKIMSIFPTKHAITFVTDEGIEGLVHMGIDTVELNGEGFTVYVKEGQEVDENSLLAEMDVNFIKEKGKDIDIITVFTNLEENNKLVISPIDSVKKSHLLGHIAL